MARIMVTIPDELLAKIDQAAEMAHRNRSEFLREAARTYLQQTNDAVEQPRGRTGQFTMAETRADYVVNRAPVRPPFATLDRLPTQDRRAQADDFLRELEQRTQKAEELLSGLTRVEKSQMVERLVRDLSGEIPGIERTPGVLGGEPCIAGSRIAVSTLVQYRQMGASDAQLLQMYPTLQAEDLANAWHYYSAHPQEIDQLIREDEMA